MRIINYFIQILFLQILFVKVSFATLTVTTTNANCSNNGSITLSSNNGTISSFNYSGISSGSIAGSTINLSAGIYSVTATLSSGNTETLNSIIVDHEDHIQIKNWYLTGNIPSTSVNWGGTLDNPLMTGWTGITINANGCVTDIKLFAKNITGTIPNFNLPKLNYLYLGNNQLNGNIPNFNLIKFNYFNLSNNQLSGTIPNLNFWNSCFLDLSNNQLSGTIPNFNFQSLSRINLSNNQLSGTIPNFNLPNLQYLYLNNNQLSGTIPNFNLPNLRYLSLNNNQFSGNIPNFNLPNLQYLYLNNNQLSGCLSTQIKTNCPLITSIGGNISNNSNLSTQSWTDYWNNYAGACLEVTYTSTVANCGANATITLKSNYNAIASYSYTGTTSGNGTGNTLSISTGIYSITVTANNGQIATISDVIVGNNDHIQLKNWYLSGNIPSTSVNWGATLDDPLMTGWTGITKNGNNCITDINLSNKNITGAMPNFNLPMLTNLLLQNNQLSGCIPYEIKLNCPLITLSGGNISNNPSLSTSSWVDYWNNNSGACLNLNYNSTIANCGNNSTITLALNYGTIASYLYSGAMAGNGIGNTFNVPTGIYSVTVTANSGQTATLNNVIAENNDHIQLKNWYLTGNITSTSVNWGVTLDNPLMQGWTGISTNANGCVTVIDLFYKSISGTIPNFNLPNLTGLYLSNNQLSGTIPNFNLPNLTGLYLSNNQLSGTVPNFNLPNLTGLYLSNNQLSGTVPNFDLPNLGSLDLGNNQLSGTIPNFNLPNLGSLSLGNNQLSGTIPNFNLPNLKYLTLDYNQLSGAIPNFNLLNLTGLSLSSNQLSGTIPNFNLPKLYSLYLNNNQLSGCIPAQIKTNCPLITSSKGNISNNPNLSTQSWADYWNNYIGACFEVTYTSTVANCGANATITLIPSYNAISSYTYTGTTSGNGTSNTLSVPTGIYSITVTANNGQVDTLNDVIAENTDHFQLKNWYLTGNIPSVNLNWGATLNDPFMINWTGITKNVNGCITAINLSNKNITGAIPNFNLPYLTNLQLEDNQLSGCIPYEIKLNCPLITSSGGNISNNPSLSIPYWADYWNNNSGACLNLSHNSTIANCGKQFNYYLSSKLWNNCFLFIQWLFIQWGDGREWNWKYF